MSYSSYLSVPLMAVLVVVQAVVMPKIPLFGIVPQLLLLVVFAWSLSQGLNGGLIWAVVAGFFIDLFSVAPLGVTSLSALAGVTAAVMAYRSFPDSRVIMPALVTALGTIVFWLAYLLLLRIIIPLWIGRLDFLGIAQLAKGTQTPGLIPSIAREFGLNRSLVALILETANLRGGAALSGLLVIPLLWGMRAIRRWTSPRQVEI